MWNKILKDISTNNEVESKAVDSSNKKYSSHCNYDEDINNKRSRRCIFSPTICHLEHSIIAGMVLKPISFTFVFIE